MRRTDKISRWRSLPLRYKLCIYFIAFSAAMLVFLWVFQIAFLDTCYTLIRQAQVQRYASQITSGIKSGKSTDSAVSSLSRENEMSVFVYDTGNSIFEKQYGSEFNNPSGLRDINMHNVYSYYKLAKDNNGKYISTSSVQEQSFKFSGIDNIETSADEIPEFGVKERRRHTQNLIYAEIVKISDSDERFVLVTAMITPVDIVISTIRVQLIIVSIVFTVVAIILAFLVSRRLSRPLVEINTTIKQLARRNYNVEFKSRGYLEVNELSDTLNITRRELQKTDNLRQELIANISHDLRTPLTMITGYGEVMRDLPGENTPENVQVIIDEANRLTNLVNDMLDLSKLQSGAIELETEQFSITDEIDDIFQRYTKLREQEGYNISFKHDKNVYVNADRIKLGQVIYNFINNAINHCGEDKTVIVTQKVTDKRVRVEVEDHGEGIPEDKLEYIWDRYYKVDKEHKRGVIGTGLGLSIVKNILDLHGARYGVKSKLGSGSTFWFEMDRI